jgi:hypothetical protein
MQQFCGQSSEFLDANPEVPFDFQRYHTFWEVVCLERCPLSLVRINEELFERKNSGSGLENGE